MKATIGALIIAASMMYVAWLSRDTPRVAASSTSSRAPATLQVIPAGGGERRPLDYYIGSDPFSVPNANPVSYPSPPSNPPSPAAQPVLNPLEDYVYSGTVTIGGRTSALIENRKTRNGQFVTAGQNLFGGRVTALTPRSVTFRFGTERRTLAKTEDYRFTPLSKNAPFMDTPPPKPPAAPPAPANVTVNLQVLPTPQQPAPEQPVNLPAPAPDEFQPWNYNFVPQPIAAPEPPGYFLFTP